MHFYKKSSTGRVSLVNSVDSIAKAKKHGGVSPSVTGILSIMPKGLSGFDMNIWRENKLIEFTKKYPDDPPEKLKERLWGYRTDEDGTEITSSEFGTKAHAGLEEALKQYQDGADYHGPYKQYASRFIEHISTEGSAPVHMELSVLDDDLNVAGMLDLVCMSAKGKYELYDFKFRNDKNKSYDTDCCQLAIEAKIVAKQWELDYIPDVFSVVFDCESAEMKVKHWAASKVDWGITAFEKLNDNYQFFSGLNYGKEAKA